MRRAAQYLRMSTEHQQYSLQHQAAAIQVCAVERGYEIVGTYTDAAKSGVTLRKREGLKSLIEDVISGKCDFDVILVYDVSRWGRFQDMDEAAHYEFLCKSAGVPVEYCAEQFVNDSSLASSVMKALKRTMAAEYSRELSVKVSRAHARFAALGLWQGGTTGYGLRRMAIPNNPNRKPHLLEHGDRKSPSEKVIVVPGPDNEIAIVREIFRMFTKEKMAMTAIAEELNRRRVSFPTGHAWSKNHVRKILRGDKYAGDLVYGMRRMYLGGKTEFIPKSKWIVAENSIKPIVSRETYNLAQKRIASFTRNKSDEQILDDLRRLLRRKGRLSRTIIERSQSVPEVCTIHERFGGLLPAYKLIGYDCRARYYDNEFHAQLKAVRENFYSHVCRMLPNAFELRERGGNWWPRLFCKSIQQDISVTVARHIRTVTGRIRWATSPNRYDRELVTVLLRLNEDNKTIFEIRTFDKFFTAKTLVFRRKDIRLSSGQRVKNLSELPSAVFNAYHRRRGAELHGNFIKPE